jgi:hypothetical protein
LPSNEPVWVELEGVLTATDIIARAAEYDIGVACDDVLLAGDALDVSVEVESDLVVDAVVHNDDGSVAVQAIATDLGDNAYSARFEGLAPGRYALRVGVRGANSAVTTPIVIVHLDTD